MIALYTNDTCKAFPSPTINTDVSIQELLTGLLQNLNSILFLDSFNFAWAGSSVWNNHLNCSEELGAWHDLHSDSGASISRNGGQTSFRKWKNKWVHGEDIVACIFG